MKKFGVAALAAIVAIATAIEGLMWWRNVHPTPQATEETLESVQNA